MTRCEGCGTLGEKVEYIDVRVTNGVLHLCRQCLDDVNRKNPKLIEAIEKIRRIKTNVLSACSGDSMRGPWPFLDLILKDCESFLVMEQPT